MYSMRLNLSILLLSFQLLFLIICPLSFANNLIISNVSLEDRDAAANTAIVEFDISWENSWRDTTNHDAIWIILKVTKSSVVYHGMMKEAGTDPLGTSTGSNEDIEIYIPSDKTGAFIRPKATSSGAIGSENVRLKLDYVASPLSAADTDSLVVKVIGIEMVYIPQAPFRAGDTSSTANFQRSSTGSDTSPWYIASEAAIRTNTGSFYYQTGSNTYEDVLGTTLTIPAAFPKGYAAFYCMKYEVTEGLWVDFIQSLTAAQQTNRDITLSTGKNSDSVVNRNTYCQTSAACTGVIYGTTSVSTSRPDRAMSYMSWMDMLAFLDWAALRPMTELEFEKISRGPVSAVSGEYAWGSASITAAATISTSPETGLETISTASANAHYGNITLSRGDDFLGAASTTGPLRVGIFATGSSTRATSGAGYYGVMELSGNADEFVITVGNSDGRNYGGLHGDGVLVAAAVGAAYTGNANTTNWPHTDTQSTARGVIDADGSGRRGGNWSDAAALLAVSYREKAASVDAARRSGFGGRGVRTYP